MKTASPLGDRIRDARGSLTQDELAERIRSKRPKIKVSGVRISRYERGVQQPRFSVLVAIAEETGKTLDFFRIGENDESGEQPTGSGEDDEDSEAMTRAAYHLDQTGEYALADDLRRRARRARFKAQSRERT